MQINVSLSFYSTYRSNQFFTNSLYFFYIFLTHQVRKRGKVDFVSHLKAGGKVDATSHLKVGGKVYFLSDLIVGGKFDVSLQLKITQNTLDPAKLR